MSLAKYKANKLIKSYKKGYGMYPENCDFEFLIKRFNEELNELEAHYKVIEKLDYQIGLVLNGRMLVSNIDTPLISFENIKNEIADLSNFIDFMFDKILELEKELERAKR